MKKIIYSLLTTLMMACGMECSAQTVTGNKGGHDYVDLGLPSGRLWATCNVGASKPTEYGDYFAWGETTPTAKKNYSWSTYKWCNGSYDTQTKYCTYNDRGTVDNLTTLLAEDDAATANWGAGWRMPTTTEQKELIEGCDWEWTKDFNGSGVAGRIGTSKTNKKTIFLPAAGKYHGKSLYNIRNLNNDGVFGYYWSSSLDKYLSDAAYYIKFCSFDLELDDRVRYTGQSVRAVVK